MAGMDNQSGLFVYNHQKIVFINNIQVNVLGDDFYFARRIAHHNSDHVAGLYTVIGLHRSVVNQYVACIGSFLDFGA